MFKDYLKTFLLTTLQILFVIGGLVLVFTKGEGLRILSNLPFLSIAILLILFLVSYLTHRRVDHLGAMQKQLKETLHLKEEADKEAKTWKASLLELSSGFPTLAKAIQEYEEVRDNEIAGSLIQKQRPAKRASEIVKEEARRRRDAETQAKTTQAIIEYYEAIAPFLLLTALKEPGMIGLKEPPEGVVFGFRGWLKVA